MSKKNQSKSQNESPSMDVATMVAQFTAELTAKIEQSAMETIRAKLFSLTGTAPAEVKLQAAPPRKTEGRTANLTVRSYTHKPCPYPECKTEGASRYGNFCVAHGRELDANKDGAALKAVYKMTAEKPGGVWYKEAVEKRGPGRPRKNAAAPKAATAPAAEGA